MIGHHHLQDLAALHLLQQGNVFVSRVITGFVDVTWESSVFDRVPGVPAITREISFSKRIVGNKTGT